MEMDKSKQPGIRFDRVFLSKLKFTLPQVPPDKFKYSLNMSSSYKIDSEKLIYSIDVQLYDGFELEMTGIFSIVKDKENLNLEKFVQVNAPALLMPFVRELISNVTSRTPLPHFLLPPVNILALSKKIEAAELPKD